MFQGTGSDVGKTVLVAGLCRVLSNRGMIVRPFKPQNMSNNAAVAAIPGEEGEGEIGRGQWLQAFACRVQPSVHMNPVLLKPQSETGSQIIVQGKVWGQAKGRDYQHLKPQLLDAVMESFANVCEGADIVLVEGAGSPGEINLRTGDIANMGFATKAGVPVVLIGDIDRGGVIASLAGTHTILDNEDRAMIKGFIINKFRGDVTLFDEGLRQVAKFTGWPSFGVVPWLDEVRKLPAEDSVALDKIVRDNGLNDRTNRVKIAVPVLGHIANYDEFDPLIAEPGIELVMVAQGSPLPDDAAMVILPGTKSTIADLIAFRDNGWDRDLAVHVERGGRVIGICGGYQMLGRKVRDPLGIEGKAGEIEGLGYLEVETILSPQKTVKNSKGKFIASGAGVAGYEIHLGETSGPDCHRPMLELGIRKDGAISADGKIMGCYLHGLFVSGQFRQALLRSIRASFDGSSDDHSIEDVLNDLAAALEQHVDIDGLADKAAIVGLISRNRD